MCFMSSFIYTVYKTYHLIMSFMFYADETIMFSTKPRALELSNLKIPQGTAASKLEEHAMQSDTPVYFHRSLHKAHDATYLGNNLKLANLAIEVTQMDSRHQTNLDKTKSVLYWPNSIAGKKWQLILFAMQWCAPQIYRQIMTIVFSMHVALEGFKN